MSLKKDKLFALCLTFSIIVTLYHSFDGVYVEIMLKITNKKTDRNEMPTWAFPSTSCFTPPIFMTAFGLASRCLTKIYVNQRFYNHHPLFSFNKKEHFLFR